MKGQMSIFDLMKGEAPCMMAPGVYSRSCSQRITAERDGEDIEIAIWTDTEAMIIKVNAKEFMEYIGNANAEKQKKTVFCKNCRKSYCQSLLAERWCTFLGNYTEDDNTCEYAEESV